MDVRRVSNFRTEKMELVCLGSGTATTMAFDGFSSTAMCIRSQRTQRPYLLIDAGIGTTLQCIKWLGSIPDTIYISCNSIDYISELDVMIRGMFNRGRQKQVTLVAQEDILSIIQAKRLYQPFFRDKINLMPVKEGQKIQLDLGGTFVQLQVFQGKNPELSYGFILYSEGKPVLSYTAESAYDFQYYQKLSVANTMICFARRNPPEGLASFVEVAGYREQVSKEKRVYITNYGSSKQAPSTRLEMDGVFALKQSESLLLSTPPSEQDKFNPNSCFYSYTLFESTSCYYIVGNDRSSTTFSILQIDRTSNHSDLSIVEHGPFSYKKVKEKIYSDTTRLGLRKTLEFFGIMGIARLPQLYIILITKQINVGKINGISIYKVEDTVMLPIHRTISQSTTSEKYKALFSSVNLRRDFYFSYAYDLTHTLQYNLLHKKQNNDKIYGNLDFAHDGQYNEMFCWNYYLVQECLSIIGADKSFWFVPIIYGFFRQYSYRGINLTLLARRSRHMAGARYLRRGIDKKGNVANEVETEQIIQASYDEIMVDTQENQIVGNLTCPVSSFVMIRGSIPLFWKQTNLEQLKPDVEIYEKEKTNDTPILHFSRLFWSYGSPIIILNLIRQREKIPRETLLGTNFETLVRQIDEYFIDKSEGKQHILWLVYDFITCRENQKNVVAELYNQMEGLADSLGVFAISNRPLKMPKLSNPKPKTPKTLNIDLTSHIFSPISSEPSPRSDRSHNSLDVLEKNRRSFNSFDDSEKRKVTIVLPKELSGGSISIPCPDNSTVDSLLGEIMKTKPNASNFILVKLSEDPKADTIIATDEHVRWIEMGQSIVFGLIQRSYSGNTLEIKKQTGVFRINCIDCLDRTNVAMFVSGKIALSRQLKALNLPEKEISRTLPVLTKTLQNMFREHGDRIAEQYAGSGAMHKSALQENKNSNPNQRIHTQQGVAAAQGVASNAVSFVKRYYKNHFRDVDKQCAINLFLGNYIPGMDKKRKDIWELDTSIHFYDYDNLKYQQSFRKALLIDPSIKCESDNFLDFFSQITASDTSTTTTTMTFHTATTTTTASISTSSLTVTTTITATNTTTETVSPTAVVPLSVRKRSQFDFPTLRMFQSEIDLVLTEQQKQVRDTTAIEQLKQVNPNILFGIERSKNKNLVIFEAILESDYINKNKPLDVYWLKLDQAYVMKARQRGKNDRQELSVIEKNHWLKYNCEPSIGHMILTLGICTSLRLSLGMIVGTNKKKRPVVTCMIQDTRHELVKVYVTSKEYKYRPPKIERVEIVAKKKNKTGSFDYITRKIQQSNLDQSNVPTPKKLSSQLRHTN